MADSSRRKDKFGTQRFGLAYLAWTEGSCRWGVVKDLAGFLFASWIVMSSNLFLSLVQVEAGT